MTCPVCSGPKTKRAQLCSGCRTRAIAAGVNLLIASATSPSLEQIAGWASAPTGTASAGPELTDGQRRAFYAKANHLDALLGQRVGTSKAEALEANGVASVNDLTQAQASHLLDVLATRIAEVDGTSRADGGRVPATSQPPRQH